MKQLTDEVFAQVRGALEQADIYLEEGSQSHSINRLAIAALDAAQSVQVNTMLVEALEEARNGLAWYQAMYPGATDGSDDEAMERIDAALTAAKDGASDV